MPEIPTKSFYIIAHEPGAEHPAIPTWANQSENPARYCQVNQLLTKGEACWQACSCSAGTRLLLPHFK